MFPMLSEDQLKGLQLRHDLSRPAKDRWRADLQRSSWGLMAPPSPTMVRHQESMVPIKAHATRCMDQSSVRNCPAKRASPPSSTSVTYRFSRRLSPTHLCSSLSEQLSPNKSDSCV